jgi:hypothetical protein
MRPRGVLARLPRGISKPRSVGARTHALGGVLVHALGRSVPSMKSIMRFLGDVLRQRDPFARSRFDLLR